MVVMNKAVELFETAAELFQRNLFRAVVVLWLAGLTVFFLLDTVKVASTLIINNYVRSQVV